MVRALDLTSGGAEFRSDRLLFEIALFIFYILPFYRPFDFPSYLMPLFQNKSSCKIFHENKFDLHDNEPE